ncbi:MAG: heme A synthase [Propionibacteriales bacterium]|nr:heme A synthase [Propionibacteriales bacterium]
MGVTTVLDLGRYLRPLAIASLILNIGIVLTGGAVRLTSSGLGCPTWPRCTDQSWTPHGALDMHGAIEFGNRMFTFVLAAVAVATWVAAMQRRPVKPGVRPIATVMALGIPGQAGIGGLTVLTDLNPWIVSLHLMLSMGLIGLAALLLRRLSEGDGAPRPVGAAAARWLVQAIFGLTVVVLYAGTVVTGSGPHAGDVDAPRNGLDPRVVSQVHGDLVVVLVLLTIALLVLLRRMETPPPQIVQAAWMVLAVELGQGAVGITQYYLDLPRPLVELHLLGAALLMASVTWLLLSTRTRPYAPPGAESVEATRSVTR